ncbi:MAG: hypothetical protein EU542_01620 [Promethearchaeota archaeon]|nr:MAG: hypothetical protein EU542_01620 [Candidatus Lokiarchaeota archaeon]
MVKRNMISGIKRKATAIESAKRYFKTVNALITHLKREKDRQKIFELINNTTTLEKLFIATAAVHLYHNKGIKVSDSLETNLFSYEATKNLEIREKKILMEEIEMLLKDSFSQEINMLSQLINIENLFLSLLIEKRIAKLQDDEFLKKKNKIENKIENNIIQIISNNPSFYFYDLIGDLMGYNSIIKEEILEESSAFKAISVSLEKKLDMEEKEDLFIEVSALNRLIQKVQSEFEFKSYKELQIEAMPVRMIKKRIFNYEFEKFPISIEGLIVFQEANNLKHKIIENIRQSLHEKIQFDLFEQNIKALIRDELIYQLKKHPNDFLYYLECLSESTFDEVIYNMNKRGIHDILQTLNIDKNLVEEIKKKMIRYNIKKQDLLNLNDKKKDLLYSAKQALCNIKIKDFVSNYEDFTEYGLNKYLYRDEPEFIKLWKILEEKLNCSINDIREFTRKKQIIDEVFFQNMNLNNYSQILFILSFDEIIENIVKDIYLYNLSKIFRQLSRIIELYHKITNDKSLINEAIKKMEGTLENEDWVKVKLEELIIKRIMKRQKELVTVFNAKNQVFLVNGFILSRFMSKALKHCINELRSKPSLIYEGIKPLTLKADLISPISYCLAFDLIKRLEMFEEIRKSSVKKVMKEEQKKEELKRNAIAEIQRENTLNWIERRITSALMGITRKGINPNRFYWQEKDTKTCADNIKLHSEKINDYFNGFVDYFRFTIDKIREFLPNTKIFEISKINNEIKSIIDAVLVERIGHSPNSEDIAKMLDGERYIISKQIATKIGKILDDALYYKFKSK